MKDDKYFDLGSIKEKDLIMAIQRLPRGDRRELAADRLFAAGSWICTVAFGLANDCHLDLKLAVKKLRDAISDARVALRILDCLLKEVKQ